MASVGAYLRELRERRGLSLDEIARVSRVGTPYLEALEADRFSALPAPVFTRGFVRAYCQALGEPPDEALARYDGRDGAPAPKPTTASTPSHVPHQDTEPRSRSAVLVSFVLLVVLGMALVAVALMTQPAREERRAISAPPPEIRRPTPLVAAPPLSPAPPITDRVAAPATPPATPPLLTTPQPPPAPPAPAAVAPDAGRQTPPPAPLPDLQAATAGLSSPYRLVARVSEPTWIRVRMEDGGSTEETVPAGGVREWVSNRPFILTVGNAGGVALELNGRALPMLGARGAVISRIVLPSP
jgi:cytoskeleton protein RodZ